MAHIRKRIRDNLVSTLTGLTSTGSRVYSTRVYPIEKYSLPALAIYTKAESTDYITMTMPRTLLRTMVASIDIFAQSTEAVEDEIDEIASQVETALYLDVTRGGLAKDTRIASFEADFSGDPDKPVGSGTITVEIDYVTLENDPEVSV